MMAERASVHGSLHRYQDGSVIRSANLGSKHLSGNQKMQMYLDTRFGQSAMQMHLDTKQASFRFHLFFSQDTDVQDLTN
jgi:hypothetical protein